MSNYLSELWIGELKNRGGYHWEVKGVPKDDYEARVVICQEMMGRLKQIKDFCENIVIERKANKGG